MDAWVDRAFGLGLPNTELGHVAGLCGARLACACVAHPRVRVDALGWMAFRLGLVARCLQPLAHRLGGVTLRLGVWCACVVGRDAVRGRRSGLD